MADNLQGFNEELASNAVNAAQRIGEIQDAVRSLRKVLQGDNVNTVREYRDLINAADKFKNLQSKVTRSGKDFNLLIKDQIKIQDSISRLSTKIQIANERVLVSSGKQRKNLEKQVDALVAMRDEARDLDKYYQNLIHSTKQLNTQSNYFTELSKLVNKIPILKRFQQPFEKAAEAARKTAIEVKRAQTVVATVEQRVGKGGRNYYVNLKEGGITSRAKYLEDQAKVSQAAITAQKSVAGAGAKVLGEKLGESLTGIIKGAGWIALIAGTLKTVYDLFIGVNNQSVEISRNLGTTREGASEVRDYFNDIQNSTKETYINITSLIQAQSELTGHLQRAGTVSTSTLKAQTFLTERMKVQGELAANLTARSEAFGENSENVLKSVLHQNALDVKRGKSLITQKQVLEGISKVSGQIAAFFGFSNRQIAEGVKSAHEFGLNLQQAQRISESLLDFESSIGNELEAELLTGKEFNLERARVLALTGDIASATGEVMKQMEGLTAEQRKSPIIMKTFSNLLGLSNDEIQDAYLLEHDRNRQKEELLRLTREHKNLEAQQFLEKHGLNLQEMKDAQGIVTLEEQYKEAVTKVKDQFAGLVNGGYIDMLTDAIKDFANFIQDVGFGSDAREQRVAELVGKAEEAVAGQGGWTTGRQAATLQRLQEQSTATGSGFFARTFQSLVGLRGVMAAKEENLEQNREIALKQLEDIKAKKSTINTRGQVIPVKDFIIKPLNEDTITMAGGTKLGGNVENLLKELIQATREGGNIYLNHQKLNENIGLNLHSLT